jgi:hypothetical protein
MADYTKDGIRNLSTEELIAITDRANPGLREKNLREREELTAKIRELEAKIRETGRKVPVESGARKYRPTFDSYNPDETARVLQLEAFLSRIAK